MARLAVGLVAVAAAVAQDEPSRPVYFVRDIAPIFDREGCSASPCHGKSGGQGGLQLSLMTLEPTLDHAPLEPLVDLQNPEQSRLLQKPSGQLEHGGGRLFNTRSTEYQTILRWIQEGCRNPRREALPVSLTVSPERIVFTPENKRATITVTAQFADGSVEDVTERTRFIAQDDSIASVTRKGHVRAERWGMTAIVCRYVGLVKPVYVSMARESQPTDGPRVSLPVSNIIDAVVFRNLEWLNLQPSGICDDYTFLRRASLDLVGALPQPDEIERFVADADPRKRERLVDRLMADPRFVDLRALRLGDMLRINPQKLANGPLQDRAAIVFDTWIRDVVRSNWPYDDMVYALVTANGSPMLNGPANFYRVERSAEDRAETIGQAFLGVRLACARCHNHPFDRWKTDDYWAFAAFTAKVRERPADSGLFDDREFFCDNGRELRNQSVTSPNRGEIAVPTFLGGPALPKDRFNGDYLQALGEWLVHQENPFFAKAAVNRVWSHFMGRGVIEPVDDIRETSVAGVPALLDVLAAEFVRGGYDTKALIRLIVTSTVYQLETTANATNVLDKQHFSRHYPKQMIAQVLLDAVNHACGTVDRYRAFPPGTTAVGLPLLIRNEFLDKFGVSNRQFLANLDPHVEPTLTQTLHMINSGYINGKITAGSGTVAQLEQRIRDDRELVRALYLRTLCRPPTESELGQVLAYIAASPNRRQAFEDLLWALITSREFLFVS